MGYASYRSKSEEQRQETHSQSLCEAGAQSLVDRFSINPAGLLGWQQAGDPGKSASRKQSQTSRGMTGLCKAWNGESVPPFTQPVGRRRCCRRLPHFAPLRRRVYICNYSNTPRGSGRHRSRVVSPAAVASALVRAAGSSPARGLSAAGPPGPWCEWRGPARGREHF